MRIRKSRSSQTRFESILKIFRFDEWMTFFCGVQLTLIQLPFFLKGIAQFSEISDKQQTIEADLRTILSPMTPLVHPPRQTWEKRQARIL